MTEVKSFDGIVAGGNLPSYNTPPAGAEPGLPFAGITHLNCIQQAATVSGRIGNKVVIRSLHFKGTIGNSTLASLGIIRFMLIYDRQPNGAFPTWADILTDQPAGTSGVYSSINIANKSRWQFIRDKFFNLDSAQAQVHTINWYCKGRWEVEYGASTGTVGDFRTGAIYLVGIVSGTTATVSTCSCRVRYYD